MSVTVRLAPPIARCVDPEAPRPLRLAVIQGVIPLAPAERLCALATLLSDPDEEVRGAARGAWQALPSATLDAALGDPQLPEMVLHLIVSVDAADERRVFQVLEHPGVGPRTLLRLCSSDSLGILSRIAQNQRLLDRHPEVALELLRNELLDPGERGRLVSLYAPETTTLPPVAGAPESEQETPPLDAPESRGVQATEGALPPGVPAELLDDEGESEPLASANLYQYVQTLSVADKVKLAMLGSKGARKLLIRDTNKIVSTAVIRSPKIREDEVQAIAQDRTVSDEVIRNILTRKDWLKSYPIRLALAQNPKTPVPRALRLLDTLQERDLRQISKSRNVASPISTGAVRILAKRGKV